MTDLRPRDTEELRCFLLRQFLPSNELPKIAGKVCLHCQICRFFAAEPEILKNVSLSYVSHGQLISLSLVLARLISFCGVLCVFF